MSISGVKAKYLSGGLWKKRKLLKGTRGKQESGRSKGLVPPAWARYCARSARAYKTDVYARWEVVCTGDKVKWSKTS